MSSSYDSLYSRQLNRIESGPQREMTSPGRENTPLSTREAPRQNFRDTSNSDSREDFYRGFYEGMVQSRSTSSSSQWSRWKYALTTYVAPALANSILFLLPLLYLRFRTDKKILNTYPFSYFKAAFSQGAKNKPSSESLMDIFSPLKPKNFEIQLRYEKNRKVTTFRDVLGVEEAKKELLTYKNYIETPQKYTRFGGKLPKGMLMIGKPGTGKTLLMRAFVNECNRHLWEEKASGEDHSSEGKQKGRVALFSAVGSDFIELYGGSGPKRVRELFQQAKQKLSEMQNDARGDSAKSCAVVIFIDEIDALGCRGGGSTSGGRSMSGGISSEENRTINQILSELDGLESAENIVVVGATNNPEALDKALLREGRFDKKVHLFLPDIEARKVIFKHYLEDIKTDDIQKKISTNDPTKTLIATELAERTPGTSPAQISTIVNEAAITAAVKENSVVSKELLHDAVDDVLIGKKRRGRMSETSVRRTSVHECGHCLVAWFFPEHLQTKVLKISLIPRGMAGGYTQQLEREDSALVTIDILFSTLCVLVGGRVAEEIAYTRPSATHTEKSNLHDDSSNVWDGNYNVTKTSEGISTGAYDDLQRATRIATEIILSFGISAFDAFIANKTSQSHSSSRSSMLSFPVQEKKSGRGWLPFSDNHHRLVEEGSKRIIDAAFVYTRKLLKDKHTALFSLSDLLLKDKELDAVAIEKVLGPRPKGASW